MGLFSELGKVVANEWGTNRQNIRKRDAFEQLFKDNLVRTQYEPLKVQEDMGQGLQPVPGPTDQIPDNLQQREYSNKAQGQIAAGLLDAEYTVPETKEILNRMFGVPDTTNGQPTTFAMGADNGQMVRGLFRDGQLETAGQPYYPTSPYLDAATGYTNPYGSPQGQPDFVAKQLAQAEANKALGVADQKRMNEYNLNLSKGEAGLEQIDFLQSNLDNLLETSTGWSTGFGTFLQDIPTSDANKWNTAKTTVLSGLGLDKMAQMKSESSTGATGLGALNEKELDLLVSYRGKLNQTNGAKEIKRVIGKMTRLLQNARKRNASEIKRETEWFDSKTLSYGRRKPGQNVPGQAPPVNTSQEPFQYRVIR